MYYRLKLFLSSFYVLSLNTFNDFMTKIFFVLVTKTYTQPFIVFFDFKLAKNRISIKQKKHSLTRRGKKNLSAAANSIRS